jgi:hypothetical protein
VVFDESYERLRRRAFEFSERIREARFCPDDSADELPIAASRAWCFHARVLKEETVKTMHRMRHKTAAARKSARRAKPVLTV